MATITEDYISFETAKLLKEKGFDEHCFCINYPLPEGGHHSIILPNLLNNSMIPFIDEYKFCRYKEDFITIPTLQMAMKWLREVHKISIEITSTGYLIDNDVDWECDIKVGHRLCFKHITNEKSFESCADAAIIYCLEHLI